MWQLASAIGEIVLRRRGPEILPDLWFLVGLLLAGNLLLSLFALILDGRMNPIGLAELGAQIVLQFGFVFAALAFFSLERRYRQTMSAILGASLLVNLLLLPFIVGAKIFDLAPDYPPLIAISYGFFFWIILIEATIFARALSQPLILGFMVEILYIIPYLSIRGFFLAVPE